MGKQKRPSGMTWLLASSTVSLALALLLLTSLLFVGFQGFFSIAEFITLFISAAWSILLIYAILKPTPRLYGLIMPLMLLGLVFSFLVLVYPIARGETSLGVALASATSIIYTGIVIWYLQRRKPYFKGARIDCEDDAFKRVERRFKLALIVFLAMVLVVYSALAILEALDTVRTASEYMSAFDGKSAGENIGYCNSVQADKRDDCLLYLVAIMQSNEEQPSENLSAPAADDADKKGVCDLIVGDESRAGCYTVIGRCDLLADNNMRDYCQLKNSRGLKNQASSLEYPGNSYPGFYNGT